MTRGESYAIRFQFLSGIRGSSTVQQVFGRAGLCWSFNSFQELEVLLRSDH
jgi:hypothetical protein